MSREITIKCVQDGTTIETNTAVCSRSKFLKNLFEEYKDEKTIEIPDISGKNMKLIMEWLDHHATEEPKQPPVPLRNYDIKETVGEWEDTYTTKVYGGKYEDIFSFLNAVNFLDIAPLLELGSAKVACLIKDFTPEEFMKLFKIEEDCTEEDLKKIEEEVLKEREEEREKERLRLEEEEKQKEKEKEKEKEVEKKD